METKKGVFLVGTVILLLSSGYYFFVGPQSPLEKNTLKQDLLIKNISWDTPFLESVPYKKGEELELNFIFPGEGENTVILDREKLTKKLKIKHIFINDETSTSNTMDIHEGDAIKIIGEALDNGILKKEDYKDILREEQKEEQEESPLKKEKEEKPVTPTTISISLSSTQLNSNINNLIEIIGQGKEFIQYVNIGGISLTPVVDKTKVYLSIAKDTFSSGEYFVILQSKNNELITLNQKMTFTHSNSKVNIANITPQSIKNTNDGNIVLQGNGFSKVISIQLSNNIVLKTTSFQIINDQVMTVKIPKELTPGNYYFNIMTVNGITELKNNIFYITN